jgi:hypothetical protein
MRISLYFVLMLLSSLMLIGVGVARGLGYLPVPIAGSTVECHERTP